MKLFFKIIIILNITQFSVSLYSQKDDFIKIYVSSKINNKALPGTIIKTSTPRYVFYTDKSGNIAIPLNILTQSDTLYFSYIGYINSKIAICKLKSGSLNIIQMQTEVSPIKKIIINPHKAEQIIKLSKENIQENYPDFPMNMKAYFAETISFNDTIIQDFEAVIDIYKESYSKKSKDKIAFSKVRININDTSNILWDYIYFVDGPYETIYADIAKYPNKFIQIPNMKINFFDERYFKFYSFTINDNNKIYKIRFKPNKNKKKGIFEGEIILNKQNLEILYLQYSYSPEKLERIRNNPSLTEIELNKIGINTPVIEFQNKVSYIKYKGNIVLKDVSNEYSFEFKTPLNNKISIIKVTDKLIITDYKETKPIIPKYYKQIPKNTNLSKKLYHLNKFTDSDINPKFEK